MGTSMKHTGPNFGELRMGPKFLDRGNLRVIIVPVTTYN